MLRTLPLTEESTASNVGLTKDYNLSPSSNEDCSSLRPISLDITALDGKLHIRVLISKELHLLPQCLLLSLECH